MSSPTDALKIKVEKSKQELEKTGYFKPVKIFVGSATCENAAGAQKVYEVFSDALKNGSDFFLTKKGCAGRCNLEPTVEVYFEGKKPENYVHVNEEKAREIIDGLKKVKK
ncbi:Ferredoxin [Endomicrobium proavitum]|uniref:Ferredoxin n=1 Tax=Endomicrobium proavitum TaxID=1408281 RepID=A0A0G3WJQ8_9BACT|nr:(2Fe-2S) ferredoxin domain-containing protein [Endomicrobium proavitum]AKL98115.1 Ferredoxin [Endomicrobium proavitum]